MNLINFLTYKIIMKLQTKALYNLVKFSSFHNTSFKTKIWQIEELREVDEKDLFKKLQNFGITLDKENILKYAKEFDSPEELLDVLAFEKDKEIKDQIYLVIFEIFRRFLPDKKCISIFCDELDYRIFLYDINQLKNDELLQDGLANLKTILDSNVDMGISHENAFRNLIEYLAHDLENFLFDYISDQIDAKNERYAFDLIDNFYHYVTKKLWFDFLRARLKSLKNPSKSNEIIRDILSELKENPSLDLQLRILKFLVGNGNRELFIEGIKQTSIHLKKEKDFKEILQITSEFYNRLDKEVLQKKILNLMSNRSKIKSEENLKKQDIFNFLNIVS